MLQGKTVLLGVTGGIAAYKMPNVARSLKKLHCNVHVLMTQNATNFITATTFETLTGNKCLIDTFDRNFEFSVEHVALAKQADLVLIAPATANVIGKLAAGIADDMLTTTVMACPCPVQMKKERAHEKDLAGKRVLVTAGPTREALDPVRFLSNHSTGKMGYALARQAMYRGAEVTLVSGPVELEPPLFVHTISVASAQEMCEAVLAEAPSQDIIIKAAAVADYRPVHVAMEKIKKQEGDSSLALERTADILKALGEKKREGRIHAFLCGFSMETEHMLENSRKKLDQKGADMIAANNLRTEGAGFGTDTNVMTLITREGIRELPKMSKEETADCILDDISRCMLNES